MRYPDYQQNANRAEIEQALREAQRAIEAASQDAAVAARNAAREAREAARAARAGVSEPGQDPRPSDASATEGPVPGKPYIVFPSGDGEGPISLQVDGRGLLLSQSGETMVVPLQYIVPRGAVQITYAVFGSLAFMLVGYPVARAFARWLDRRGASTKLSGDVQARLDMMDRNIDTVAVELERVSEGQRFTNKLLEQRSPEHAQRSDR